MFEAFLDFFKHFRRERHRNATTFHCQDCDWSVTLEADSDADAIATEVQRHRNSHVARRLAITTEYGPAIQRNVIRYYARRVGTTAELVAQDAFQKPLLALTEAERRALIQSLAERAYTTPAERYAESNRAFGRAR